MVENQYSCGWIGKYANYIEENGNVTCIDVELDPEDESTIYSLVVVRKNLGENVSFVFHLYKWRTDNVSIDGYYVYINYSEIANLTVIVNASSTPMISCLDTIILENRTYIMAFSLTETKWSIKVKVSHVYIYKYLDLDVVGDEFLLVEEITENDINHYFFTTGISLDSYNNNFVLMYSYGYYEYLSGVGLFVGYCINITYWGLGGKNFTFYDFYVYDRIISISNVILDGDVVYGAAAAHWNQIDLDFILVIAWNISDNYSLIDWSGLASYYSDYFGSPPEYKWISITLYNETNNIFVLWEGHSEYRQYLFGMYWYAESITHQPKFNLLYEDIIIECSYPSNIECIDTNYSDFKIYFLMLEYSEEYGTHVPSLLVSEMNPDMGLFEINQTHRLYMGDVWPFSISLSMESNLNIYGQAICATDQGYGWMPIVIYRDTDMDVLGDWEEHWVYGTNETMPDSDNDGIFDGCEVYIYGTSPLCYDSDDDGLDDRFELEVRPNTTYDQYGGSNNIYLTDPLDNDTDNDGISDYYEIVGKYEVGNRKGYRTDPTKEDTDEDGLSDFDEIFGGVSYWVENRTHIYVVYPNATLIDTDGDGISDYDENQLELNPTSSDTDGDGIDDYRELYLYVSNPHISDSDSDGLNDGLESDIGTNILDKDTDGDGLQDGEEVNVYGTDPFLPDTDGDGLNDYDETRVYGTDPLNRDTDGDGIDDSEEIEKELNPKAKDSDKDFIPDRYDILMPRFPDYILLVLLISAFLLFKAHTYGAFRNWRKDIIAIGVSDVGGVPLFIMPEDFETRYDINLISSGLLGIHTLTSEITGKELRKLVLSGEIPILISKSENSIMFAFIKKEYPKITKHLTNLHEELDKNYSDILVSWSGLVEEAEDIKEWIKNRLGQSKKIR